MSQEEEEEKNFPFDQPWNPVSYFEEENETTGGNACGSAYSPSRLASLFETNKLAVDQDIAMRKRLASQSNTDKSLFAERDENTDTPEMDNGIKILDTIPAVNQEAIFNDLDRLRRWRESKDKPNKIVYINDNDTDDYLYDISDSTVKESENNLIDLNMDYILSSLTNVTNFDNEGVSDDSLVKLQEGENQLSEKDNIFSFGPSNTEIINSTLRSISDKKNFGTVEDPKVKLNDAIIGDMVDSELTINSISFLNRKNSGNEPNWNIENTKNDVLCTANKKNVNIVGTSKGLGISDDLDYLFDDTDDVLELPNIPKYLISGNCEIDGTSLDEKTSNANFELGNKISNTGYTAAINNLDDLAMVANVGDINNTNTKVTDLSAGDIISSNDTADVDTFIDYVEDITNNSTNISEFKDICEMVSEIVNSSANTTDSNEDIVKSTSYNSDDRLNIEDIIDTIEITEVNNQKEPGLNLNSALVMEANTEVTVSIEQEQNLSIDLNSIEKDDHYNQNNTKEHGVSGEAIDTITDKFDSNETNYLNQIITEECINTHNHKDINHKDLDEKTVIEIISNDHPVVNTVDVSAVQSRDSIGCLTPDDDNDNGASSSGYTADGSSSSTTNINNELLIIASTENENTDSDSNNVGKVQPLNDGIIAIKTVETNLTPSLDLDTVNAKSPETFSADLTNASSSVLEIPQVDISTNLGNQTFEESISNLEQEFAAVTENEIVPSSRIITYNIPSDIDSNSECMEDSPIPQEEDASIHVNTNSNLDNSYISNSLFETPSVSTDGDNTMTVQDNDINEQVHDLTNSRATGSIRRVRFSLDHENVSENAITSNIHDEDNNATSNVNAEMRNLGWIAPMWIPDSDAKMCTICNTKFTVVKRRHHCRACGKVFCSQCCNMKFHLPYMDYKPARVCQSCCDIMINVLEGPSHGGQPQSTIIQQQPNQSPSTSQNAALPEAPPPYSETMDVLLERMGTISTNAPPYTETPVPRFDEQPAEVLPSGQAMEILPVMRPSPFLNAPISDMMNFQLPGYSSNVRSRNSRNRSESEMSAVIMFNSTVTNLPPILRRDNEETRIVNNPDLEILMKQMYDETEDPISFIVNKNLVVRVKVVNMDCCIEKKCWCFVSDGMGASNQEEVVILIKCNSYTIDEIMLTRKVLQQMNAIFEKAKHGNAVSDSEQMEFNPNIACMAKNIGMLFYKPTLQCVNKLFLPTSPYLFGMYIEKSELAWAKNFPLRLLLRIGAEYKYYPCPLFNVLDRLPVYDGVGRTILDLLADFRNFQYTLPRIVGVTINLRGKDTIIRLPRHRFDEVLKAVNAAEENVLSLAGNFSPTCDGHLVSVEKDGRYKTQTLSIVLKENRKVTCASFFVMSAALKPDQSGIKAKASIVEDGVMVQVTSDVIQEFKTAIKEMKEYAITAGNPAAEDSSQVGIEWCSTDSMDRPKLMSPIDATPFDNLTNMKIRHSYDYTSNNLTAKIHWVEVYFLPQDNDATVQRLSAKELGQMTSSIAKACMSALSPHLMTLIALEMTRIGLRVNLAANFVEYKIGSNLTTLPSELLPTLDDKLVPTVHNVMSNAQERVAVELIFQLVKIV